MNEGLGELMRRRRFFMGEEEASSQDLRDMIDWI
jgi:hypothetical protein